MVAALAFSHKTMPTARRFVDSCAYAAWWAPVNDWLSCRVGLRHQWTEHTLSDAKERGVGREASY